MTPADDPSTARPLTLDEVLATYAALTERALDQHPGDAGFIRDLSAAWTAELRTATLNPARDPYIRHLIENVMDPESPALEWLDAFPNAIVEERR